MSITGCQLAITGCLLVIRWLSLVVNWLSGYHWLSSGYHWLSTGYLLVIRWLSLVVNWSSSGYHWLSPGYQPVIAGYRWLSTGHHLVIIWLSLVVNWLSAGYHWLSAGHHLVICWLLTGYCWLSAGYQMVIAGYKSEDYRLDINRKPLSKKQSRLVLKDMGIGILKDWIEFQMFDALETIQKKKSHYKGGLQRYWLSMTLHLHARRSPLKSMKPFLSVSSRTKSPSSTEDFGKPVGKSRANWLKI